MAIGARSVARVEVDDDAVRVVPVGLARLWTLKWAVNIPLVRIKSVDLFADEDNDLDGQLKLGRFRAEGVRAFLVVGRRRPVVVIECPGAEFDRVVFSAKQPELVEQQILHLLPTHLP